MRVAQALSVSQLTRRIKNTLEGDPGFQRLQVEGEIGNLTVHRSGHAYFSLKDEEASISCVMFRSATPGGFTFEEGAQVVASGALTLYPPRGVYQLQVRRMQGVGQGNLFQQFVALKEKLQLAGLFDTEHKRGLPYLPRHIAVITSPTGAVIRDILHTLGRRYPHVQLTLIPAQVQGTAALPSLLAAFDALDSLAGPELVILARGGGSMEDLWCFNEEALAHAIYQSPIPVISAVGHETDFTIADFVADVRAPTPTAAAEICVPEAQLLYQRLDELDQALQYSMQEKLDDARAMLQQQRQQLGWALRSPLQLAIGQLQAHTHRLDTAMNLRLQREKTQLQAQAWQLAAYDLAGTLARGFSLTLKNGKRVTHAHEVQPGDRLQTLLADGSLESTAI